MRKKYRYALTAAAAIAALSAVRRVHAATLETPTWTGENSGDWTAGGLWSSDPNYPDNDNTYIYIATIGATGGTAYNVSLDSDISITGLSISSGDATLSQSTGVFQPGGINIGAGTYSLSGGSISNAGTIVVDGSFIQTGGSNVSAYPLTIGRTGNGSYSLSGASYFSADQEFIGATDNGSFFQSGGTNSTPLLRVGASDGYTGIYSLSGNGLVTITGLAGAEEIGFANTYGIFNQSGGTNSTLTLNVGMSTASCAYTQSGGLLTASTIENVGVDGVGTFMQVGGTNSTLMLKIGGGTASASGGYLLTSGFLSVGTMNIQAGAVFNQSGGTLSPSTPINNAGSLIAGMNGNFANSISIASGTLASGSASFSGFSGPVFVGFGNGIGYGSGTALLVDPATFASRSYSISGQLSGLYQYPFSLTVNGSSNSGILTLTNTANNYPGTFILNPNTTLVSQAAGGSGSTISTASASLNGGTLTLNDDGGGSNRMLAYGNNLAVTSNSTLNVNPITASTGNTIAIGGLAMSASTLTVNSTGGYSVSFTSISGGGTLAGNSAVKVTGTIAPGDAPAVFNVNNFSFALTSTATYSPEIIGGPGWVNSSTTNAGVNYDQINILNGAGLSINGATLNLRLSGSGSYLPGYEYFLINESAATAGSPPAFSEVEFNGAIASSIGMGPNGGQEYRDPSNSAIIFELDYTGDIDTGALTGGNEVVLDVAVPEPASLSLLGLGAMSLLARRRRKRGM